MRWHELKKAVLTQWGRPQGRAAAWTLRYLNATNWRLNALATERLEARPEDRVLDIGFGGGVGLAMLLSKVPRVSLAGVDLAQAVIAHGERKFDRAIQEGRVEIRLGAVESLPWPDGTFDAAYSVNCIYFWPDHARALHEIRRVLKPGGRFILAIYDKRRVERLWPGSPSQLLTVEEAVDLLRSAGFEDVRFERRNQLFSPSTVVLGHNPSAGECRE